MKLLNFKIVNLFIIMMLFFSYEGISQNRETKNATIMVTILASGDDASGSTGTVAYSIGQVFYTYSEQAVYNVAQGIQHEEENLILSTPDNDIESTAEIVVYPNPSIDFVNVKMNEFESQERKCSYVIYDYQGRLLKQNQINESETQINLMDLSPSMYILNVYANNKVLKTFKILKN